MHLGRKRRAVHVRVEEPDAMATGGEEVGQLKGNGGLANPALARGDGDDLTDRTVHRTDEPAEQQV